MLRKALMSWPVISEYFLHSCAGGKVERQIPADEILCVAPNVS